MSRRGNEKRAVSQTVSSMEDEKKLGKRWSRGFRVTLEALEAVVWMETPFCVWLWRPELGLLGRCCRQVQVCSLLGPVLAHRVIGIRVASPSEQGISCHWMGAGWVGVTWQAPASPLLPPFLPLILGLVWSSEVLGVGGRIAPAVCDVWLREEAPALVQSPCVTAAHVPSGYVCCLRVDFCSRSSTP